MYLMILCFDSVTVDDNEVLGLLHCAEVGKPTSD
jgi:hypothetical protein